MSNNSLYLVQSCYSNTLQHIQQLQSVYTTGDALVLMGEAVLHIADEQIQKLGTCFVLESDAQILGHDVHFSHMHICTYAEFADLCLKYQRCITLK